MTTVVAASNGTTAVMAADSMTTTYDRRAPTARKIVRARIDGSELLLGFSGGGGLADAVVAGELVFPELGPDPDSFARSLACRLADLAVTLGLLADGRMDANVLLARPGGVWMLIHRAAIRHNDDRSAIGTGGDMALGALDALLRTSDDLTTCVQQACRIAVDRDIYSGGDIVAEQVTSASS